MAHFSGDEDSDGDSHTLKRLARKHCREKGEDKNAQATRFAALTEDERKARLEELERRKAALEATKHPVVERIAYKEARGIENGCCATAWKAAKHKTEGCLQNPSRALFETELQRVKAEEKAKIHKQMAWMDRFPSTQSEAQTDA